MVREPSVQAELEADPTGASQRNVVARQIDTLEAIYFFKLRQAVRLLVAVGKVLVHEVSDISFGTRTNRLSNQRIRGSLVPVFDHRDDVHQVCLCSILIGHQFNETNQLFAEKCPNEQRTVQERRLRRAYRLDVLAIVNIRLSLSDGALIVDLPHSLDEGFIERHLTNHYPFLLCLPGPIPSVGSNLVVPPLIEGGHAQDRQIVPLHGIGEFWGGFRHYLHEREEVDPCAGFPQAGEQYLRVSQKFVLVQLRVSNPDQRSPNIYLFTANYHELASKPPASRLA